MNAAMKLGQNDMLALPGMAVRGLEGIAWSRASTCMVTDRSSFWARICRVRVRVVQGRPRARGGIRSTVVLMIGLRRRQRLR